jgi:hypothetical protein
VARRGGKALDALYATALPAFTESATRAAGLEGDPRLVRDVSRELVARADTVRTRQVVQASGHDCDRDRCRLPINA